MDGKFFNLIYEESPVTPLSFGRIHVYSSVYCCADDDHEVQSREIGPTMEFYEKDKIKIKLKSSGKEYIGFALALLSKVATVKTWASSHSIAKNWLHEEDDLVQVKLETGLCHWRIADTHTLT